MIASQRGLILCLAIACSLGLTRAGMASSTLVDYVSEGGVVPMRTDHPHAQSRYGSSGHFELRVQDDGTLAWYDQRKDEQLPGRDGWTTVHISAADLADLKQAIAATPFDTMSIDSHASDPRAVDGTAQTLTIHTASKTVTLHLWQVQHAEDLPLVKQIRTLQTRYAH